MVSGENAERVPDTTFLTGEEAAERLLNLLGPESGRLAAIGLGMLDSALLKDGIDPATMKRTDGEDA